VRAAAKAKEVAVISGASFINARGREIVHTYITYPYISTCERECEREAVAAAAVGLYLGMSGRRSARGDRFPSVCTKRALASVCE
jgi:hypothetical protein